jgi:cystathionine beta-lyase/cystathionine gamma-synthase
MTTRPDPEGVARRDGPEPSLGFSTRTIRAASRLPEVRQRPTSAPIFQTATFASMDSDEEALAAASPAGGDAYGRLANPTTSALGAACAEHTMVVRDFDRALEVALALPSTGSRARQSRASEAGAGEPGAR